MGIAIPAFALPQNLVQRRAPPPADFHFPGIDEAEEGSVSCASRPYARPMNTAITEIARANPVRANGEDSNLVHAGTRRPAF